MVEYAIDIDAADWRQKHSNEYQAFLTLEQWNDVLSRRSLQVVAVTPFPNQSLQLPVDIALIHAASR